jgi:hypothetical protein
MEQVFQATGNGSSVPPSNSNGSTPPPTNNPPTNNGPTHSKNNQPPPAFNPTVDTTAITNSETIEKAQASAKEQINKFFRESKVKPSELDKKIVERC